MLEMDDYVESALMNKTTANGDFIRIILELDAQDKSLNCNSKRKYIFQQQSRSSS